MILKERTKSVSHLVLESLNYRTTLSSVEQSQYENQVKGFKGEVQFDRLLKEVKLSGLIINDLLLSTRDTYYQIDTLLVTDDRIYLYEVKNYSGSYHYRDGVIYSESGHAIQNPVAQADRKRAYLHNLLLNLGYQIDISTHVVYIDPDFYIYSLPPDPTILFAGQLSSHFDLLSNTLAKQMDKNLSLAKKLVNMHAVSYRPANLPNYPYDRLEKGILCPACFSFAYQASRQMRTCSSCGHQEKYADAILRSIEELSLLFPTTPLTKRVAHEWCGNNLEKSRIKHVLKSNYRLHHAGRSSYYH